jgi:hypothetical protein
MNAYTVPSNISLSTIDVTPTYENTTSNLTKLTTGFNAIVSVYVEIKFTLLFMMLTGK